MSIRFNGDKQALRRTANLPTDFVEFTICGCIKLVTPRPTHHAYICYTQSANVGGDHAETVMLKGTNGTELIVTDNWEAAESSTIATMASGGASGANWYFFAMQGTAAGAGGLRTYLTPISPTNTLTYQTVANTPATKAFSAMQIGDAPFAAGEYGVEAWWFDGMMAHLSVYDRALSEAELLTQSRQAAPASELNLLSYHAFDQTTVAANLNPTYGSGAFEIVTNSPSISTDMPSFSAGLPTLSGSDVLPSVAPTVTTELGFTGAATGSSTVAGFMTLVTNIVPPPAPPPPVDTTPPPAPVPPPPPATTPEVENPELTYAPILLGFYTDSLGYITMKQANATLDYGFDWTSWLNGDTIATSAWAVESGLTKGAESVSTDRRSTSVFLSGGVAGGTYLVTNTIVTATGRSDSRTFRCRVI